eukprot:2864252-Alexandrium_andersonii.AAC.1
MTSPSETAPRTQSHGACLCCCRSQKQPNCAHPTTAMPSPLPDRAQHPCNQAKFETPPITIAGLRAQATQNTAQC